MSESLQEFYDRHKDFVYSYVLCAFGGNTREAKQMVVELFREFFEKAEKNKKYLSDEFLHSLLRRRTRSYAREHKKSLSDMPPPSSYQTRLQHAVGTLPQLQQDCVLFKYIYGLTPKPLSRLLDKTEASIRQNLSRGTKRIFELLKEDKLDSRSFRIPLSQIPNSVEQKLRSRLRPTMPTITLPFEGLGQQFGRLSQFLSRKKLVSFGILLLIIGGIGELPKFVYKQDWIVPGNVLYSWKKDMELDRLEKLRHPANLANFYLSLSNRRIKEAHHMSQKYSLALHIFPEALAQSYEPRKFPMITFDINPKTSPQSGLVAESGLMMQRAIEYAGSVDQPTTLINVLKNIRLTLDAQQMYLAEIARWSREPQIDPLAQSFTLIHQLNTKVIEHAGQQVAEQALAAQTHIEPLYPVPIKIILHQEDNSTTGSIAESIQIHQQFRPMIRPQDEGIKSFAEAVLEADETMLPIPIKTATIESLMREIESIHFPERAKSSAEKQKAEKKEAESLFEEEPPPPAPKPETKKENKKTKAKPNKAKEKVVEETVTEKTPQKTEPLQEKKKETPKLKTEPEPKQEVIEAEPIEETIPETEEQPPAETTSKKSSTSVNQDIDTEAIKSLSNPKPKSTAPADVPVETPEEPVQEIEIQEEPKDEEVEIRS